MDNNAPSGESTANGSNDILTLQVFEENVRREIQAYQDRVEADREHNGSGEEALKFPPMSKEQRYIVYVFNNNKYFCRDHITLHYTNNNANDCYEC